MTPTPTHRRTRPPRPPRRAAPSGGRGGPHPLCREVPGTLGVLADEAAFTAMSRYPSFRRAHPCDDHAAYLARLDHLLRTRMARGLDTGVALFDPRDFADHCARHSLDPDTLAGRTHYTARLAATGPLLTYTGQALPDLLGLLAQERERQQTWEHATGILTRCGDCATCGRAIGRAALETATTLVTRLLAALEPGSHHLVCSVPAAGRPLVAVLRTETRAHRTPDLTAPSAVAFRTVLAAGIAQDSPCGLVTRTTGPLRDTVRGWTLRGGRPRALTAGEVFAAYCTDAETGEPVAPEPGVDYAPGIGLDLPDPGHVHR